MFINDYDLECFRLTLEQLKKSCEIVKNEETLKFLHGQICHLNSLLLVLQKNPNDVHNWGSEDMYCLQWFAQSSANMLYHQNSHRLQAELQIQIERITNLYNEIVRERSEARPPDFD